jgi:hypothetical protein
MIHDFFLARRPHNGMTFDFYFEKIKCSAELEKLESNSNTKHGHTNKLGLNFQRMQRIIKTYSIDSELLSILQRITEPQLWLVLTEDWCGDSAQIIPYLAKMAGVNPLIDLRIMLRDENLDIMDLYLSSENTRSIPKLISFSKDGEELFQWGARPAEADNLVKKLKAEGQTKDEFMEQLHLWYARNRGRAIENELKELLIKYV